MHAIQQLPGGHSYSNGHNSTSSAPGQLGARSNPSSCANSLRPLRELRVYTEAELLEATGGFSDICLIGQGGFGKVYRAMVHLTPVAIKVLDHEGLQGLKEMHTEMTLLAGLWHPFVVRLLGYSSTSTAAPNEAGARARGCDALVYELMTGGNLEDRLARTGGQPPLPWGDRVKVGAQVAAALAYLHSKNIVHRDMKPANVFLGAGGTTAKLGDIGLAAMDGLQRGGEGGHAQRGDDEAVGTWAYLAPEYRAQGGRCSMRTDAYAFGLVMLQLLSGSARPGGLVRSAQLALEDCTVASTFLDSSAGTWDARVAERMVKLALWCCMHDPEARPPMATVASQLAKLTADLGARDIIQLSS